MEWGGSISITITIGPGHQWCRCGDTVTPCPGRLPLVRPHIRNPGGSPMLETISVSNPIPTVPTVPRPPDLPRCWVESTRTGPQRWRWGAGRGGCGGRGGQGGLGAAPRHKQRRNVRKGCHQHQQRGQHQRRPRARQQAGPSPQSGWNCNRAADGRREHSGHPASSSSDTSLVLAAWTGTSNHTTTTSSTTADSTP